MDLWLVQPMAPWKKIVISQCKHSSHHPWVIEQRLCTHTCISLSGGPRPRSDPPTLCPKAMSRVRFHRPFLFLLFISLYYLDKMILYLDLSDSLAYLFIWIVCFVILDHWLKCTRQGLAHRPKAHCILLVGKTCLVIISWDDDYVMHFSFLLQIC